MAKRRLEAILTGILFVLACGVPRVFASQWNAESYIHLEQVTRGNISDNQEDIFATNTRFDRMIQISDSSNGITGTSWAGASMYASGKQSLVLFTRTTGLIDPELGSYQTKSDGYLSTKMTGLPNAGRYAISGNYDIGVEQSFFSPTVLENIEMGFESPDGPFPILSGSARGFEGMETGAFKFEVDIPANGWISFYLESNINNYGSPLIRGEFTINMFINNLVISYNNIPIIPEGTLFAPDHDNHELKPSGIPTPIPGAAWLLGTGLLGLIGVRRKMKT